MKISTKRLTKIIKLSSRQLPLTPHMPNSTEDVYHLVPQMLLATSPATLRFYPSLAYLSEESLHVFHVRQDKSNINKFLKMVVS